VRTQTGTCHSADGRLHDVTEVSWTLPDYCWQTAAAWIKMPLGMEVDLGLHDIVFDVDPATPRKKGTLTPPNFWPMSIVAKCLDG